MKLVHDSSAAHTSEEAQIDERILALTLKDEKFAVHTAASDQEIDDFFTHIHFIEPQVDRDHLRKENLKDLPALKQFMDKHCNISQYVFQVKKCKDESCFYCTGYTVRMPKEVFNSLSFLPLPRLDSTKARLSLSSMVKCQVILIDLQVDKENSELFHNTRVQTVIPCQECTKPR